MRMLAILFSVVVMLILLVPVQAQVTNLVVNGSSSNFTFTSGDAISWSYNLPNGATADIEIWIDVNNNGTIDPGTDKTLFTFQQTDGNPDGNNGPPDMDGLVNGEIQFSQAVGLAPSHYIFKATHNSVSQQVTGTVQHLSSPAHTVSGQVSGPTGMDLSYLLVEVKRNESYGLNFWDALTDSNGFYTVELNSDTAGNPWRVRVENAPAPYLVNPAEISLTINSNHSGNNFTLVSPAAQVVGYYLDENNNPLVNTDLYVSRNDNGQGPSHNGRTDNTGFFQIGVAASELNGNTWRIAQPFDMNGVISTTMLALGQLPALSLGDSVSHNLVAYATNSSIQGQVLIDGNPPNFPLMVFATNDDSAESFFHTDSTNSNFTIPVSNKISNYRLWVNNFQGNYNFPNVVAHPGDTGVILNFTTTSVKEIGSTIPTAFAVAQNYPNPFNPTTVVEYSIPASSRVRLSIINVLGQEVLQVVDEDQQPGTYRATVNASKLPTGMYFYRIEAGKYNAVRKMVFLK